MYLVLLLSATGTDEYTGIYCGYCVNSASVEEIDWKEINGW